MRPAMRPTRREKPTEPPQPPSRARASKTAPRPTARPRSQEGISDAAALGARAALGLRQAPLPEDGVHEPLQPLAVRGRAGRGGPHAEPRARDRGARARGAVAALRAGLASASATCSGTRRFEQLREALLEAQERAQRLATARRGRAPARGRARRRGRSRSGASPAQNPSFTGDLLRNELVKTDRLVDAFVDMAVDLRALRAVPRLDRPGRRSTRDRDALRAGVARPAEPDDARTRRSRRRTSPSWLKRLEKMQEIRRYLSVARGQLDLIENSFQLIADQIVTMQSPQELSGQLDELLDGVEAIRQTALDTERILRRRSRSCDVADAMSRPRAARVLPAWAEDLRRRYLAERGLDVRPARQRLRRRAPRREDALADGLPDRRAAQGHARRRSRSTTWRPACASRSAARSRTRWTTSLASRRRTASCRRSSGCSSGVEQDGRRPRVRRGARARRAIPRSRPTPIARRSSRCTAGRSCPRSRRATTSSSSSPRT